MTFINLCHAEFISVSSFLKKTLKRAQGDILILISVILICSNANSAPVLLSFDVEKPGDEKRLEQLNVTVPATYFFLGKFAEENKELVRSLAENGHTIGSHAYSHENLKQMGTGTIRLELKTSKELLEEITGKPVIWFRAPFLEYNDNVIDSLVELGYKYDSSEHERWRQQNKIIEFPVSTQDGTGNAVSDYDMFERIKMSDEEAFNWLKERYLEREGTNRPLMVLLHPSIIGDHKPALDKFIEYVKQAGGSFLTGDQWVEQYNKRAFKKLGFWIDFSVSKVDTKQLIEDAKKVKATDIFLMTRDQEGHEFFGRKAGDEDKFGEMLKELKKAGFKVHAWFPMFKNPKIAQLNPDWAMHAQNEKVSIHWLSPHHPDTKYFINEGIKHILQNYDIDGLHLDYIRYPGLAHDFSKHAVDSMKERFIDKEIDKDKLLSDHYSDWVLHRQETITGIVENVHNIMEDMGKDDIPLSAALIAESSINYRGTERFAQNYSELAKYLDIIIPMSYFKAERKEVQWIENVYWSARFNAGDAEILTGLASYQQPTEWKITNREFESSVKLATDLSEGIVFYNYANLFGRGDISGWNMNKTNIEFLENYIKEVFKDSMVPVKIDNKTKMILLTSGCLLFIFISILVAIRRKNIHGSESLKEDPKDYFLNAVDLDFKQIGSQISSNEAIDSKLVSKVSSLLKNVGVHNINHFRKMLLLQIISENTITLNDLQKKISSISNITSGLRRIEELALLSFIKIDGQGTITITELGKQVLEKSKNNGYKQELISFIDKRLNEQLIITCGKCDEPIPGLWFWEDFECYSCKSKYKMSEAKEIKLQRK
jgi:peptidoglycan/xylan/chitin deacetylase (PgdA/CDA1 family)/uncharacterized lipoprotein YddW (UPF0748 family)